MTHSPKIVNRTAVIAGLASHILERMSNDDLFSYAHDQLSDYFEKLSEDDLIDECDNEGFEVEIKL